MSAMRWLIAGMTIPVIFLGWSVTAAVGVIRSHHPSGSPARIAPAVNSPAPKTSPTTREELREVRPARCTPDPAHNIVCDER